MSWFPLQPPDCGYKRRATGLYSALSKRCDLLLVSPGGPPQGIQGIRTLEAEKTTHRFPAARQLALRALGRDFCQRVDHAAHGFAPDFLIAEGLWAARAVEKAAKTCGAPWGISIPHLEARAARVFPLAGVSGLVWALEKRMYSRADRLFPATVEEVKRLQRTLRTRMPRFTLVPHGTHLARDVSEQEIRELRERWHIREGEHIGLFVGEMSDRSNRRGLKWFSQAVRPQIGALPFHVRWVAVGATRPAGVVPPFEFVGYVDDLAAPLAAADLCIAPAFGEGTLPIKVLDYMGAGCPIVATPSAVQGLPIEKDHHLFVTQDPEEFARSVRVIILDPGLAYEFGKRSRDLVAAELTWEIIAEKLARDLARMLGMP